MLAVRALPSHRPGALAFRCRCSPAASSASRRPQRHRPWQCGAPDGHRPNCSAIVVDVATLSPSLQAGGYQIRCLLLLPPRHRRPAAQALLIAVGGAPSAPRHAHFLLIHAADGGRQPRHPPAPIGMCDFVSGPSHRRLCRLHDPLSAAASRLALPANRPARRAVLARAPGRRRRPNSARRWRRWPCRRRTAPRPALSEAARGSRTAPHRSASARRSSPASPGAPAPSVWRIRRSPPPTAGSTTCASTGMPSARNPAAA